ncbi:hypothetical protein J1C56_02250 [Aminobacter anthyllidis]|uniref:Uncharacterized protein n=1 Tax=Aminobacter anthyllidis TaxID=1035067 RepID=A0A9X1A7A5_9HYPH|nr:hypothetical protein [Aminobacter anthyllidis]MBT1154406.1 hypothetical protein [Aminobacter anthyllidis]
MRYQVHARMRADHEIETLTMVVTKPTRRDAEAALLTVLDKLRISPFDVVSAYSLAMED